MANSNLIANLNSIYATKLEIKEVLNTESDDFTQYPDLIEAAIASGGASGYTYITENGDHDIAAYAYVNVNVHQQEVPVVPPGYSYVYGTKEILENGTVNISSYASAYVNVPAPEGWILPSGYAFVTSNGNFDIREFESVNVNVPQGGAAVLGNLTVSENGQYSASSYSYDGFDVVNVNVPQPTLGGVTITSNGIYSASDFGYDGLSSAIVNVPTGGGSTPTMNVSGKYGVYNSKYYIYDTNNFTYLTFNGPISNVNLGDTVSGTAEYVDFDGSGMIGSYLFKNFTGTSVQDPNRIYTNFTIGSYWNNIQTLISPINGSINSQAIEIHSSEAMMTTYLLSSNYSGPQFESGSTVYCYVSTANAMAMTQNLINEVVSVTNPVLTGMSYSTDNGMTWNSMSYDSLTSSYSVSGLSKSISAGSSDNSIYIRQEFDNATYKYVSPYIEFNPSSTSPIQMMVTPNTMMSRINFYNMSGAAKEITGFDYNVNSNYISVSFQQGIEYAYRIVVTDSTGVPDGNKYDMQNDPALGWKYNNWYSDKNIEYFYIEKVIAGESTGIEEYKPSTTVTMDSSTSYPVSTAGTGLFHLTERAKNQIIFNVNNMNVKYYKMDYISLKDSNGMEICKVYSMDVGTTFNNTNSVSGCYFTDAGGAINYKPSENISISSSYDGNITVGTANSGTISFDAGNYALYYWYAAIGNEKGVFIHGITTP